MAILVFRIFGSRKNLKIAILAARMIHLTWNWSDLIRLIFRYKVRLLDFGGVEIFQKNLAKNFFFGPKIQNRHNYFSEALGIL